MFTLSCKVLGDLQGLREQAPGSTQGKGGQWFFLKSKSIKNFRDGVEGGGGVEANTDSYGEHFTLFLRWLSL